jgi:transposase
LSLGELEKAAERYDVRKAINEILDYIRTIALNALPRKQ